MEQIVSLKLFGKEYKFRLESEDLDAENIIEFLVQEVEKVDKDFNEKLKNGLKKASVTQLDEFVRLLIASLNISNDYYRLKNKHNMLLEKFYKRSSLLKRSIDEINKSI